LLPLPFEFLLFAATLGGVALFHQRTLLVALTGLASIVAYKFVFTGFDHGAGAAGLLAHMDHEWMLLANLALLLTGFELLARHFEQSRVMDLAPRVLPNHWTGGLLVLFLVLLLSGVLDNIAAALLGGAMARHLFKGEVTLTYLAAIVASSNAGGAGSVLGDTTTTMLWIAGAHPLQVLHAYVGAFVAFCVFAPAAAIVQQRQAPIYAASPDGLKVDWIRVAIALACLFAALGANIGAHVAAPHLLDTLPLLGLAVWGTLLVAWIWRKPDLHVLPEASAGTLFLLALVLCASLMPVKALPNPTAMSTLGIGFISAVFDNIPLTKLAIDQGGYDWAMLAYAVGFGGSMMWFGSSAGVAVANLYPQTKSVWGWLRAGWLIPGGYVVGFFAIHLLFGWAPSELGG
jgi:Na+/H+ antiporter NhaD/arsenite permease-like protein